MYHPLKFMVPIVLLVFVTVLIFKICLKCDISSVFTFRVHYLLYTRLPTH